MADVLASFSTQTPSCDSKDLGLAQSQSSRLINLTHGLFDDTLISKFSGCEAISQAYGFSLHCHTQQDLLNENILAANIGFNINLTDQHDKRYFNGHVYSVEPSPNKDYPNGYKIVLVPWIYFLRHDTRYHIHHNKNVIEIINAILTRHQQPKVDASKLVQAYPKLITTTQYNESSFDFINRILTEANIYYRFLFEDNTQRIQLFDHLKKMKPISLNRSQPRLKSATTDYFEEKDNHYDYLNNTIERSQKTINHHQTIIASEQPSIPLLSYVDNEHFVSKIQHTASDYSFLRTRKVMTHNQHYANTLYLKPTLDLIPTPALRKPHLNGAQTAIVVAQSDRQVETDPLGRIRVRFHWQESDEHSGWIRVKNAIASDQYGSIAIPHINTEVIIDFINGDVDQPVVIGSLYNANNPPPVSLTEPLVGFYTAATNISFDDSAKAENFFIHTAGSLTESVAHNKNVHIGTHSQLTVTAQDYTIHSEQSISINAHSFLKFTHQKNTSSIDISPSGISINCDILKLNSE